MRSPAVHRSVIEWLEPRTLLSDGPRIIWSNVRDGGEYIAPDWFRVTFDQPLAGFAQDAVSIEALDDPAHNPLVIVEKDLNELSNVYHLYFERLLPNGHPTGNLAAGRYRLTIHSGANGIQGLDGTPMDGEVPPSGMPPSGDGVPGGDFVVSFSVLAFQGPPPSPKALNAVPISDHEIELEWFDDTTHDWNFLVERAEGDGPFSQIASYRNGTDANPAHYIDDTAARGVTYRYRVRGDADDDTGHVFSPYSNEIVAQVLPEEITLPVSGLATQTGAAPDWLTAIGETVFFTFSAPQPAGTWTPADGIELWKTDGTEAGTAKLFTGTVGSLINFNGFLFFAAQDSHGLELWKSNGTVEGTSLVVDVRPGSASSSPRMLGVVGSKLFFAVPKVNSAYELWSTDGTPDGTAVVSDELVFLDNVPEGSFEARRLFTVSGGFLYFRRATAAGGDASQLWRTDGTDAGTIQITGAVDPSWLTDVDGTLFFASNTNLLSDPMLYKVDPGSTTATLVKTIQNYSGGGTLANLTAVGGLLFFGAESPIFRQMWRSDGTEAGTFYLVGDAPAGLNARFPNHIVDVDGQAFYLTNDVNWNEDFGMVRRDDGTSAGMHEIHHFDGRTGTGPILALEAGGKYVFSDGLDLWITDGDHAHTYKIDRVGNDTGIRYGPRPRASSYAFSGNMAVAAGESVFFSAPVGSGATRELRVASLTPPTAPSTVQLQEPAAPASVAQVSLAQSASGVQVIWTDNASNEAGYIIDRFGGSSALPQLSYFAPANSTSLLDPTGSTGGEYLYRVRSYNAAGFSTASFSDNVAPTVLGQFRVDAPRQALELHFNENVTVTGTLQLSNLTTGQTVPADMIILVYDANSHLARFTFDYLNGVLPDGEYRAMLAANAVGDAAGNPMTANYSIEFFVLAGDLNQDRQVSISDFITLAANFGKPNATYFDGDLNYDGQVTISDFIDLSSNFGHSFVAAPPIQPQAASGQEMTAVATTDDATREELDGTRSQDRLDSHRPAKRHRHHLRIKGAPRHIHRPLRS